jgi:hypothetical protein
MAPGEADEVAVLLAARTYFNKPNDPWFHQEMDQQ